MKFLLSTLFLVAGLFKRTVCLSNYKRHGSIRTYNTDHIRELAISWLQEKDKYDPLYSLRIIEALDAIKFSYNHFNDSNACIFLWERNDEKYIILALVETCKGYFSDKKSKGTIEIHGILEHPENVYNRNNFHDIKKDICTFADNRNFKTNFKPIINWSHGFYFKDVFTINDS
tara:strand:+ start:12719 stop:13237 length:519 start_codon:yes stop_codon:yes gene_type:complete